MKYIVAVLIFLSIAALILGLRAFYNHMEIKRLKRNGYYKIANKRRNRGSISAEFMRTLAELCLILLLLTSLLGWMGFH